MDKTLGEGVDPEWMELILKAKQIGLSMDEIRAFLRGEYAIQEPAAQ